MRIEGRIREHEYFQSRWWDSLDWGLLESEWREQTLER
jgi:RimJ/RimL family protein N-acetyltransferase